VRTKASRAVRTKASRAVRTKASRVARTKDDSLKLLRGLIQCDTSGGELLLVFVMGGTCFIL
jgi:hypothetical protein